MTSNTNTNVLIPKAYAIRAAHLLSLSIVRIQNGQFGKALGSLSAARGNIHLAERDIRESISVHGHKTA